MAYILKAITGSKILMLFPLILEPIRPPPPLRSHPPPPALPFSVLVLPFRRTSLTDEQQLRPRRIAEVPERADTAPDPGSHRQPGPGSSRERCALGPRLGVGKVT